MTRPVPPRCDHLPRRRGPQTRNRPGQSDEWAWRAQEPSYCYDLHATILHLMGIDHTKLTFRHNGIDRRLTDVHGHVIEAILA